MGRAALVARGFCRNAAKLAGEDGLFQNLSSRTAWVKAPRCKLALAVALRRAVTARYLPRDAVLRNWQHLGRRVQAARQQGEHYFGVAP